MHTTRLPCTLTHSLTTAQAFDALVDGMLLTAEEEVSLLNSLPFPTTSDTNDTDAASWLRPLYASRLNKYDTELPVEEQFDGLEEVGLGETPYVVRTPHTARVLLSHAHQCCRHLSRSLHTGVS